MKPPRIFDTVPMHDEIEMLEARIVELEDIPNLVHVIVEADVTHQDEPKPSYLSEHWSRFEQWEDRIIRVWATGLPTLADDPDPWAREIAQREHCWTGLRQADAQPDDVVLHGDLDEIPRAVAARNVRPSGFVSFEQIGLFWAVDLVYEVPWYGTVAGRVGRIQSFGAMRSVRNTCPQKLPNAGFHLSWLPKRGMTSAEAAMAKVGSFCHPEVEDRIVAGVANDRFLGGHMHVDGKRLIPVDIDSSWPKYVWQRRCPESWFRPR